MIKINKEWINNPILSTENGNSTGEKEKRLELLIINLTSYQKINLKIIKNS